MLQRTKSKRIAKFHDEYAVIFGFFRDSLQTQCKIQGISLDERTLHTLFAQYEQQIFTTALRLLD